MIKLPKWRCWFSSYAWVSALAFLFAALDCLVEINDKLHYQAVSSFKILLSIAIVICVGLAWWVQAVQEGKKAPRKLSEKQKETVTSLLKDYALQKPTVEVYYSNDIESKAYAIEWEKIIAESGWNVVENKNGILHGYLTRFHGIEVQVRKKSNSPGDETVEGAPARFIKAVQTVEPKVKPQLTKEINEGVIRLNIGAKE